MPKKSPDPLIKATWRITEEILATLRWESEQERLDVNVIVRDVLQRHCDEVNLRRAGLD